MATNFTATEAQQVAEIQKQAHLEELKQFCIAKGLTTADVNHYMSDGYETSSSTSTIGSKRSRNCSDEEMETVKNRKRNSRGHRSNTGTIPKTTIDEQKSRPIPKPIRSLKETPKNQKNKAPEVSTKTLEKKERVYTNCCERIKHSRILCGYEKL